MKRACTAAVAVCVAMLGCSQLSTPEQGVGTGDDGIHITGRVLDKDGRPMANTVVKLKSRDMCDTTDADGNYCIAGEKDDHSPLPDLCDDSLEYSKDGQVISNEDIPGWNCRMPDVYLIQRDIYGDLTSQPQSFSRITATISRAGGSPEEAEIWYNDLNQSFSGFAYFCNSEESVDYSVYVSIYDASDVEIGRSVTLTFPSKRAGDLNIPAFDPNNELSGSDSIPPDTVVQIPDTIPQVAGGWRVLVDDATLGYINTDLHTLLDGTSYLFPRGSDDPRIDSAPEPDLSPVASILGDWLSPTDPVDGKPYWSLLREVPKQWEVNAEIAVIYPVWGGDSGIADVRGSFGVDNGIFVWVNGVYKFGAEAPLYALQWEYYDIPLGSLHPGWNYIEILLEDQGLQNDFTVKIVAPE